MSELPFQTLGSVTLGRFQWLTQYMLLGLDISLPIVESFFRLHTLNPTNMEIDCLIHAFANKVDEIIPTAIKTFQIYHATLRGKYRIVFWIGKSSLSLEFRVGSRTPYIANARGGFQPPV